MSNVTGAINNLNNTINNFESNVDVHVMANRNSLLMKILFVLIRL